jgi:thiol-disulfide isomerase/thioredoxin
MADQQVRRAPLAAVTLAAVMIGSVAACGPAASPRPDVSGPPVTASPSATASAAAVSPAASPSDGPVTSAAPAVTLEQPWATEPLVDVASGETFRIADLAGRPVIVETMAIWCSNCFAQQRAAYEGLAALGSTDLVYLLVDVDPNESAADLADYRDDNGFTGRYVVASQALARALVDEFGDQILNPPSTPLFTIATDGTVTLSPYGSRKSADEIVELARSIGA